MPQKKTGIKKLDFCIQDNEIIFTAGRQKYRISKERLMTLFDEKKLSEESRKSQRNKDNDGFTLETFARISTLMEMGLKFDSISKVLKADESKIRQFYNSTVNIGYRPDLIDQLRNKLREENLIQRRPPTGFEIKHITPEVAWKDQKVLVEPATIKKLLDKGFDTEAIASNLNCEAKELEVWIQNNKKLLSVI